MAGHTRGWQRHTGVAAHPPRPALDPQHEASRHRDRGASRSGDSEFGCHPRGGTVGRCPTKAPHRGHERFVTIAENHWTGLANPRSQQGAMAAGPTTSDTTPGSAVHVLQSWAGPRAQKNRRQGRDAPARCRCSHGERPAGLDLQETRCRFVALSRSDPSANRRDSAGNPPLATHRHPGRIPRVAH